MKKMNNKTRFSVLAITCAVAIVGLAAGIVKYNRSAAPSLSEAEADMSVVAEVPATDSNPQQAAEEWADSIMKKLTPRQRIAQLFVPRWDFQGGTVSQTIMQQQVVNEGVGGFLLGKGSLAGYVDVINKAQSMAKVPLLVTLDGEWGLAMRIPAAPRFPKNIALGAIQDLSLLEEYGREVARECKLTGIQVDFAPALDVNSNPKNPVIGYRSFGEDPARVAALGAAFCRGMESGGVMSVGKHFPGHGDTSVDSHKALPTVDHSKKQMEEVDFLPFIEAQKAGMSGIMVGHLKVPSLDKSGTPSSLSKIITTDILQNQLGFDGLIFTDALAMKGAANATENNCVSAFKAGADIMLSSGAPVKDIQAMADAVKSGVISQAEVDRRCRKLLIYKYNLGLAKAPAIKKEGLQSKLFSPETKGLLDRLAKASITVVKNEGNILPLGQLDSRDVAAISLGAASGNEFESTCKRYTDIQPAAVSSAADVAKALDVAKKADIVIVGVFKNDANVRDAFAKLRQSGKTIVPVFFINPFKMADFGQIDNLPVVVAAYDETKELFSAGAQALFGGFDVTGRFPVNITGVAKIGAGVDLKKKD